MPMTAKEIIKILEQNGFTYVRANGSHRMYKNNITGKVVVVPYHKGTLKLGTERNILKTAGLLT